MIRPADDYERWQNEVRDPATANAEPTVRLRHGREEADYTLAPIPGGWAWTAHAYVSNGGGGGTPWTGPVSTKADAREAALLAIVGILRCNPNDPDSELANSIAPDQGELF